MRKVLIDFVKGIVFGVAGVLPGVSGGTLAVVLNMFDSLIEAINNFYKEPKKHIPFLLSIGLGAIVGIFAFSAIMQYCLTNFSFPTSILFVGLVCGSLPLLLRKASPTGNKISYKDVIAVVIGFIVVALFAVYSQPEMPYSGVNVTFSLMVLMFIGGIISGAALIVPGISGSVVMMIMGIYTTVIAEVLNCKDYLLNPSNISLLKEILGILVPLALGVVVGIIVVSKIFGVLLSKFERPTYFTIIGLTLGSIFGIFAEPMTYYSGVSVPILLISIVLFVVGCAIAYGLDKL